MKLHPKVLGMCDFFIFATVSQPVCVKKGVNQGLNNKSYNAIKSFYYEVSLQWTEGRNTFRICEKEVIFRPAIQGYFV